MKSARVLALVTVALSVSATAHADPDAPSATSDPTSLRSDVDPPLKWRWERFRPWEYPITAVALGGAVALRLAAPAPSADWTGGILFDDWVQDHTAIQGIQARLSVKTMTDVLFYGSMAYRLLDSALVPLLVWQSPRSSDRAARSGRRSPWRVLTRPLGPVSHVPGELGSR